MPARTAAAANLTIERAAGALPDRLAAGATALAIGVRPAAEGPELAGPTPDLGIDYAAHLTRAKATGEAGQVTVVPLGGGPLEMVVLVGLGDGAPAALRKAGAALARAAKDTRVVTTTLTAGAGAEEVRAFAEGASLASYRFSRASEPKPVVLERIELVDQRDLTGPLGRAAATAAAVRLARDLTNTPSLEKSPEWLAAQARAVAKGARLDVRIRDEKQLAAEGFGGICAVGAGSARPPRLIELTYAPDGARRHVVLVGKGITFDSGGLSLKPNDGMVAMKTDMGGGAAVIGAMSGLAALGVRVKVTGLVPAAENLPSGSAVRPGDVITHVGGTTVEVLNTDAEGRLVLADALAYAAGRLRPDALVDLATLTGAASLGLGRIHAALYASEERLATGLLAGAAAGGEPLWRMPLTEDYRAALDSDVADLRNIADPDRHFSGGSIVAALFLREFVGSVPWAHLDIAGPARSDKERDEINKGGTGYGVRLLLRWLESYAGG